VRTDAKRYGNASLVTQVRLKGVVRVGVDAVTEEVVVCGVEIGQRRSARRLRSTRAVCHDAVASWLPNTLPTTLATRNVSGKPLWHEMSCSSAVGCVVRTVAYVRLELDDCNMVTMASSRQSVVQDDAENSTSGRSLSTCHELSSLSFHFK